MAVALFIYLLSIASWLGAIIFFSFFTAPILFNRLPVGQAGKVVAGIFPRYYALGYVTGLIALTLAVFFATVRLGARTWWSATALALAISLGLTLYAGLVVRPGVDRVRAVAEASNPKPADKAEFDRLHHLSVVLNGAVLLLNLGALATTAGALATRG